MADFQFPFDRGPWDNRAITENFEALRRFINGGANGSELAAAVGDAANAPSSESATVGAIIYNSDGTSAPDNTETELLTTGADVVWDSGSVVTSTGLVAPSAGVYQANAAGYLAVSGAGVEVGLNVYVVGDGNQVSSISFSSGSSSPYIAASAAFNLDANDEVRVSGYQHDGSSHDFFIWHFSLVKIGTAS